MSQSNSVSSDILMAGSAEYRLSATGRKVAVVLLAGVASIFAFAGWTLYRLLPGGIDLGDAVPFVLMVGLLISTPLLAWNIIEELAVSVVISDDGLVFRSAGIAISCSWNEVVGFSEVEAGSWLGGEGGSVHLSRDCASAISNPLLRFLHWQANGPKRIRLYASLDDRESLQARIKDHISSGAKPAS